MEHIKPYFGHLLAPGFSNQKPFDLRAMQETCLDDDTDFDPKVPDQVHEIWAAMVDPDLTTSTVASTDDDTTWHGSDDSFQPQHVTTPTPSMVSPASAPTPQGITVTGAKILGRADDMRILQAKATRRLRSELAATAIQARFRGYQIRRWDIGTVIVKWTHSELAATVIQAHCRGYLTRRHKNCQLEDDGTPITMQIMELLQAEVNEYFNLDTSSEVGALSFCTDAALGQRAQYADSPENASFNLIRPARTQSLAVEGRRVHLFMVTLDSLLTVQMARCTASQVDDYKGIKYLGFSPARPILKPFQRALTNIKLD
eukprot:COSAG05_NODE_1898_length_3869_cov_2361.763130_5_plen_314_part_01